MSKSADRRSRRPVFATCLASIAVATVLVGCGSSASSSDAASGSSTMSSMSGAGSSSPMSSPMSSSADVVIHISQFAYTTPTPVAPGARVTVMNMDGERHTVTADSGTAFDTSVDAGGSSTFTAPTKPGSYPFHCTFHSNMHGTLVVK
jgi:plastocyanin